MVPHSARDPDFDAPLDGRELTQVSASPPPFLEGRGGRFSSGRLWDGTEGRLGGSATGIRPGFPHKEIQCVPSVLRRAVARFDRMGGYRSLGSSEKNLVIVKSRARISCPEMQGIRFIHIIRVNIQGGSGLRPADTDAAVIRDKNAFAATVAGKPVAVEIERLRGGVVAEVVAGNAGQARAVANCCWNGSGAVRNSVMPWTGGSGCGTGCPMASELAGSKCRGCARQIALPEPSAYQRSRGAFEPVGYHGAQTA